MLHPDTEVRWISAEIGCGVLATRDIPKGTILWAMDPLDRTLSPERVELLPPVCRDSLLKYSYRNRSGDYVYCWDNTRFMNHSFYPNSIATAYGYELAVCDIRTGEELCNDYGTLNILEPFRASDEGSERKVVYPDDLARHHQRWDEMLEAAFRQVHLVDQPLREILSDSQWEQACQIAKGLIPMDSILNCLYRPAKDSPPMPSR